MQISPAFQRFMLCHFTFTLVPFSLTKRNLKRIFAFTTRENSIHHLFCKSLERQQAPSYVRMAPPSSFPGTYTASQHQASTALNCVCKYLCFILIYVVQTLAKCVRRHQKSLKEAMFWFRNTQKFFHVS